MTTTLRRSLALLGSMALVGGLAAFLLTTSYSLATRAVDLADSGADPTGSRSNGTDDAPKLWTPYGPLRLNGHEGFSEALILGLSADQALSADAAQIDIEKATNGHDADAAPGVFVPSGDPITWTYVLTNTGSVTFTNVTVSDDMEGAIDCPGSALAPQQAMTCEATGTAIEGQYGNTAAVTAAVPPEPSVSDEDSSHYFGMTPAIAIEKSTNGEDADVAPGPYLRVGSSVDWTYTVTNTGNVTLTAVTVTDDQGASVSCPSTELGTDQQMVCTASGTADPDQYTNTATAVGTPPVGSPVQDTDPSHYFGADPGIVIEKATNGHDADAEPGPTILVGDPITWTYTLTNTGNVTLTNVTVSDDALGPIMCAGSTLAPQEAMICEATGTAGKGQHTNLATATGTPTVGSDVSDTDPSHYFGGQTGINAEKDVSPDGVDWRDADAESDALQLDAGADVWWRVLIRNTGDVALTLTITDTRYGELLDLADVCDPDPPSVLEAGDSYDCAFQDPQGAAAAVGRNVVTAEGRVSASSVVAPADAAFYVTERKVYLPLVLRLAAGS